MDSEGNDLNLVTGDYIAGLTDGEGCFYINLYRFKKYPNANPQTRIHFYIKLRQDDLPVLQGVQNTLGFGHINYQRETRSNHSPCYRYEISDREKLHQLLDFFRDHPLHSPKKLRDMERIKTILTIIHSGDHLTQSGLTRIRQIKTEMHS